MTNLYLIEGKSVPSVYTGEYVTDHLQRGKNLDQFLQCTSLMRLLETIPIKPFERLLTQLVKKNQI